MVNDKEYEALRREINEWQSRSFAVANGCLLVVVGILGWAVSAPDKWSWDLVSSLTSIVLSIGYTMIWMIGLLNSKISTYIEVFHEGPSTRLGWEGRQRKFKKNSMLRSKSIYALMFFCIQVLSLVLAYIICNDQPTPLRFFLSMFLFFVLVLTLLMFSIFPQTLWADNIERWRKIRAHEADLPEESTQPDKLPEDFPSTLHSKAAKAG